jgi:hypothetical protein
MKRIINELEERPPEELLQGSRYLLKIFSPAL